MKTAIYPGSFDPITFGHIDIVERSLAVFDRVIIAVLENPEKQTLFSIDERIKLISKSFEHNSSISVEGFSGLLVDFFTKKKVFTMIRGLRFVSDFEFEFQMALTNRKLASNVETVFFMTDEKYSSLSSSIVRQVAQFGGDLSPFVLPHVEHSLKGKFNVC